MDDAIKKYLVDIKEAIVSIENYLGDKRNFERYQSDKMLRRAVEREFEIIGEALNKMDKIDQGLAIAGKKQIIALRNRVIHNYDAVDNAIIWGIIIRHLPVLKEDVNTLLGEN
jgi:uncharacterized protein with HEPN domain